MQTRNAIQKLLDAGLSRGDVAVWVGCTRSCVSHWETARSVPKGDNLAALVSLATSVGVVLFAGDFGGAQMKRAA